MLFRVQTWFAHTLDVELSPQLTVKDLKEELQRHLGTAAKDQELFRGVYKLHDMWQLSNLDALGEPCVIDLVLTKEASRSILALCKGSKLVRRFAKAPADKKLVIVDFDDTIAVNGQVSDEMANLLRAIKKAGHFLSVASFNRSVLELLRIARLDNLFDVIVGGFSQQLSKADIVLNVLKCYSYQELPSRQVLFLDDKSENIADVDVWVQRKNWVNIECLWVSSPSETLTILEERCLGPEAHNMKDEADMSPRLSTSFPDVMGRDRSQTCG
mmetsp:Transcript_35837/g.81654  ORF Transcript_35837/g.81654 Transcript_35837/m.81654 type:complete len:271 (-) Transcript_35837:48-860(-)